MTIGIVLVIFTVYKLMGVFTGKKAPTVKAPGQVATVPAVTDTGTGEALSRLRQQLRSIESEEQDFKTQVQSLDASVSTVKEAVVDINSKLADINYTIQNLSHTIQEQQKAIEELRKARKRVRRRRITPRAVTKYRIEAMIPGRAWLKSAKGVTMTVGTGSRIPGYGTVRSIDVMEGVVRMSSGRTIGYGPDDR